MILNYFYFILFFFYFQLKKWKPVRGETVRTGTYSHMGLRFSEFTYKVKSQALESVYLKHIQKGMNELTHFKEGGGEVI